MSKCINCAHWNDGTSECGYVLTCLANDWDPEPSALEALDLGDNSIEHDCTEFEELCNMSEQKIIQIGLKALVESWPTKKKYWSTMPNWALLERIRI